jgi:hypothetical protein
MNWASSWGKRDKKKKGKVEEAPAAKEPDQPVDDFSWGSFGSKDKKKDAGAEEKEKEAEPVDEFAWGSFGTTDKKKNKKGKVAVEEPVKVSLPMLFMTFIRKYYLHSIGFHDKRPPLSLSLSGNISPDTLPGRRERKGEGTGTRGRWHVELIHHYQEK